MHQTTIRFGDDLWGHLSDAAEVAGTSVAQYVREAAVTRLASDADRTGDVPAETAGTDRARRRTDVRPRGVPRIEERRRRTAVRGEESSAVWAQARQARRRAEALRREAAALRFAYAERRARGAAPDPRGATVLGADPSPSGPDVRTGRGAHPASGDPVPDAPGPRGPRGTT